MEDINQKLTCEDQTLRTFRRAIGFGRNVRSDLIPLLENTKDEAVLDAVIRILVNLTVPLECLFSVDVLYRTEVGRHTIFELNQLLYTSKEAFTDPKSTKSVVDFMKHILESESKLSPEKCDQINNCLLLLRNILHIPENNMSIMSAGPSSISNAIPMQNAILWNLFIQSIDKLLLYLMTCPQRAFWGVTMVQLIALMYKDQHVSTLQKMLSMWFEASLSESSEDNESNTSPPKQGSGDSSPMLTSDPTSDSSDNGKCSIELEILLNRYKLVCISAGSGGGSNAGGEHNDKAVEERRQAVLRTETEATLQEVSRKGHEYQNAMTLDDTLSSNPMSFDNENVGTKTESFESNDLNLKNSNNSNDKLSDIDYEDGAASDTTVIDSSETKVISMKTSKSNDAAECMPPPATPLKAANATSLCQQNNPIASKKVPHAGQLNLTKGVCMPQKRECPSSQSEHSDCGYGTQVENQESISTSSNDDETPQDKPQHQKPPCNSKNRNKQRTILTVVDKKELRRKKLVKRSKSSL